MNRGNKSNAGSDSSSASSPTQDDLGDLPPTTSVASNPANNFLRSISYSSAGRLPAVPLSERRGFSIDSLESDKTFPPFTNLKPGERTSEVEHKKISRSNFTKIIKDGITQETHETTNQQVKKLQSGDISYHEAQHSQQTKNRIEGDGFSAERLAAQRQDQKTLTCGEITKERTMNSKALASRVTNEEGTLENVAMSKEEDRLQLNKGVPEQRLFNKQMAASRTLTNADGVTRVSVSKRQTSDALPTDFSENSPSVEDCTFLSLPPSNKFSSFADEVLEGFKQLVNDSPSKSDLKNYLKKFKQSLVTLIDENLMKSTDSNVTAQIVEAIGVIAKNAWTVPVYGHELGFAVCTALRERGGLLKLIELCDPEVGHSLNFEAARVLEQALCTENRSFVVEHGLKQVVRVALECCRKDNPDVEQTRVGIGLLCHLFKNSEETCSFLNKHRAFDRIVYNCRSTDRETLRHCATAFANLALYGGAENHHVIQESILWLFPLAFSNDDHTRYWACIAVAAICLNKELDNEIAKTSTLDLLEKFCTVRRPGVFAHLGNSNVHGQSKEWLKRFVPVLSSTREEARSLAAFHFAVEAEIKKRQGNTQIFNEIGAVAALKAVASSPNALASKFAAHALQLIGEDIPHKLTQQVPLWTEDDVTQWVKQIGFGDCCTEFQNTKVDGDLLLQIDEDVLGNDIGIKKQLLRKRFLRELNKLKQMADYTSVDPTNVTQVLHKCDPEFTQYAYMFLRSGLDISSLPKVTEAQLKEECHVRNSVHRHKILSYLQEKFSVSNEVESTTKHIDAFISYRRSNGSQLASLLKVHLQLKGFTVFLDVEKLEAGKFDNSLLNSIKEAKSFLLILTPNALDRCKDDVDCKDWVHKEIVQAIQSECNIIPIMDSNFEWPEVKDLPEDIHPIASYNGVNWIHDYQDACVDKIERFIRREKALITPMSPPGSRRAVTSAGRSASVDYMERSSPQQYCSHYPSRTAQPTVEMPISPPPSFSPER